MVDAFLSRCETSAAGWGLVPRRPISEAFIAKASVCQMRVNGSTNDCARPTKIGNSHRRSFVMSARCGLGRGGLDQNGSASGRMNMAFRSSTRRALLLAGTFGTLVAAWPVAALPIAASADKVAVVPGKLTLAKGFKIDVYVTGITNARSMRVGDKGTIFVGSRLQDKVYAVVDKGGKPEVKVIASGLYRPNGVAFKDGTLYIAELSKISKIEKIEDNLDNPPKPRSEERREGKSVD